MNVQDQVVHYQSHAVAVVDRRQLVTLDGIPHTLGQRFGSWIEFGSHGKILVFVAPT